MSEFLWQTFVSLFVIINPFAVVAMFVSLTQSSTPKDKRNTALKSVAIASILLLSFAFLGDKLLDAMSISEPAFRIAGGFLLLLAAIEMVVARTSGIRSTTADEQEEAIHRDDVSVFPLAIPLMAGPGALTSIVVLMRRAEVIDTNAGIAVVSILMCVLLFTYLLLLGGNGLMKVLGQTGTNVLTRVFGILLAALAVENIINGIAMIVREIVSSGA